jgi:cupin fold WbuC family metalloprotein
MYKFIKYRDSIELNKFLKNKKLTSNSVFRYNFHQSNNDKDQLMMIWQKKNYLYPPKKFLDSHKIYILMKGKLKVCIFNSKGNIKKVHTLTKANNICRLKKNVYHADFATSNISIHCEITNHSFKKRKIKFLNKKFLKKINKNLMFN